MLICLACVVDELGLLQRGVVLGDQQNRSEIRLQIDRHPGNCAELVHEVLVLVLQEIAVEHRAQEVDADVERPRAEVARLQFVVRTAAMSARGVAKSGIDAVGELAVYALDRIGVIYVDLAIERRRFRWRRDRRGLLGPQYWWFDSRGGRRTC